MEVGKKFCLGQGVILGEDEEHSVLTIIVLVGAITPATLKKKGQLCEIAAAEEEEEKDFLKEEVEGTVEKEEEKEIRKEDLKRQSGRLDDGSESLLARRQSGL